MASDSDTPTFNAFRAVFDSAPDGILIVDSEGIIREANPQSLRILGFERDDLLGGAVERVVPPDSRGPHQAMREAYASNPHRRPMGAGIELRALRSDGREVPVEISLSPCSTPEGDFVIAAIRDISAQRKLRRLGSGALKAAEEERQRIARELHDDTAQCLAALLIRLRLLRNARNEGERVRLLDEMQRELGVAMEGVRRISRGLRPPALDDAGLETALRSHFRSVVEPSPLVGRIGLEPVGPQLDTETQLVVYRIVQESLANVIRHSGAERVSLEMAGEGPVIRVTIADDGRGFDAASQLLDGSGLGLIGMQERARLVGGDLSIESVPGSGTRINLTVRREPGPTPMPAHPIAHQDVQHG